jgi:hypothetical protein
MPIGRMCGFYSCDQTLEQMNSLGAPITVDLGVDELVSPTQKACYYELQKQYQSKYITTITQQSTLVQDPATLKVSVAGANPTHIPERDCLNTDSLMSDSTKVVTLPGTYDMSALRYV